MSHAGRLGRLTTVAFVLFIIYNDKMGGLCCDQEITDDEKRLKNVELTKLYAPMVNMHRWPIVFHAKYDISFFSMERLHPFDAGKWGKIFKFLKEAGFISKDTIYEPVEASQADLLVVHSQKYLNSLKWSANVALIMEVPCVACLPNFVVQSRALKPFKLHTGGTILAARLALSHGWGINIGGGFHHASATEGGGFCVYADITLALKFLFFQNLIESALIVDLDAHQGNGHERDFTDDEKVKIFDMYNADIYPGDTKARAGIDVEVRVHCGVNDKKYLPLLQETLAAAMTKYRPKFLLYNAGTDCMDGDPLGAMNISPQGIISRDEIVWRAAMEHKVPVVMVTSGGYQRTNARVIADSILNLRDKGILEHMTRNATVPTTSTTASAEAKKDQPTELNSHTPIHELH